MTQSLRKASFPLVADADTRLLVLGSLPGEKSLAAGEYYANRGNHFWRLMALVTGEDLPALPYDDRLAALLRRGIGLWDVIADATRAGSLDSAIRDPRVRDLTAVAQSLPTLRAIAFNGGTAARLGLLQLGPAAESYEIIRLLSSSGACAVTTAVRHADWLRLRLFVSTD
ncbi:hypoxanthine-DNA glycosylase [Sphingomonas zeicaulis]|uniref:DNA-deoxyinosine glycosylase n=1 Tax=Sphingomonas zeicaulis TaxID=1632740 RepID=UPI003D25317A